jgi:hypothetical protein
MSRTVLISAMLWLLLGSPAAAACLELVMRLEEQLAAFEGQEESVEVRTGSARVQVEQAPGGVRPTESWGGASSGFPEAHNKLRSARRLAQSEDHDGCLLLVEEARIIVQGLAP